MRRDSILSDVKCGLPLLGDGAMGTYLTQKRGEFHHESCVEAVTLSEPDLVRTIHREYLEAGARLIETNTFAGNRLSLETYCIDARYKEINRRAVEVALQAASEYPGAVVAGSMGPIPLGSSIDKALPAMIEQCEILMTAGAEVIMLESFGDIESLRQVAQGIRGIWQGLLIAQGSLDPLQDRRMLTAGIKMLADIAEDGIADIIGFNCGHGPSGLIPMAEMLRSLTDAPISAFPNASLPTISGGRVVYEASPEYFARNAANLVDAGVSLIGGCCGTTPRHISEVNAVLSGPGRYPASQAPVPGTISKDDGFKRSRHSTDYRRESGKAAGTIYPEFRMIVEIDPPKNGKKKRMIETAAALSAAGAEAFSIAENPLAYPRMSGLAAAHLVQGETCKPCILHITCRDRNLIGQRSHLMGASALGLHNVLAVTGDPCRGSGIPKVTSVFDTSSYGLVQLISEMNQDQGTSFRTGVAFNANARDLNAEIERLKKKISLGAAFVQTQPIYSKELIERVYSMTVGLGLPVFPGVLPLTSLRNAIYLDNEFPGIKVGEEVIERLRSAGVENEESEAKAIAIELTLHAIGTFGRLYLISPIGKHDFICELLTLARMVPSGV